MASNQLESEKPASSIPGSEPEPQPSSSSAAQDLTQTVAKHYNQLQEAGREERTKSPIFYLRNFNNWIKSMAIADTLQRIKENKRSESSITVLDLCCGKGGDLLKWKMGGIDKLVCADIAGTSVEQCASRHRENEARAQRDRNQRGIYKAEFITADCTKVRLKDEYDKLDMKDVTFDLVSCQFSFHYCFESLPQAEMMLRNACECLKPGGYFLGTTPNSYELVKRLQASDTMSFGTDICTVTFKTEDKVNLPLFGAQYDFHLEGVVDCPEFLVYFPLLEKMAEDFNMKIISKTPFAEYYAEQIKTREGRQLIEKMQALEGFPPEENAEQAREGELYAHAQEKLESLKKQREEQERAEDRSRSSSSSSPRVGTLSKFDWQATTLYLVFLFQKMTDEEIAEKEAQKSTSSSPETETKPA